MKRILLALVIVAACIPTAVATHVSIAKASDEYVRNAVIQLLGPVGGGCTGIQVKNAAGKLFVLTAAHCMPLLADDNRMTAQGEQGQKTRLKFVSEDKFSDLMLLEGSPMFGSVDVAQATRLHDKVHTITHGGLAPSYRTDGEMLDEVPGGFIVMSDMSLEDIATCQATPKYEIFVYAFDVYCVLSVKSARTTANIIPGSSGGPLLNEKGELIGIASYGRTDQAIFGFFVRLVDIQSFLKRAAI